jgi:adenylosuccinate lyase
VGNYAHVPRAVELDVAEALELAVPDSATQVLMRDSLGAWAYAVASLVTICDAIALEVRHGQRSEVGELFEGRTDGQQGSSSMPHKANPITAEKISGLARLARSYVMPITEGIALWHERDISHSSVERVALPDLSSIAEHALQSTTSMIHNLRVSIAGMRYNIRTEGTSTMMNLYILEGMTRAEAYEKARIGLRYRCADPRTEHTWDKLALLRHTIQEARTTAGVSEL